MAKCNVMAVEPAEIITADELANAKPVSFINPTTIPANDNGEESKALVPANDNFPAEPTDPKALSTFLDVGTKVVEAAQVLLKKTNLSGAEWQC